MNPYYTVLCAGAGPENELWKRLRRSGWGASEVASLVGINPYETRSLAQICREKALGTEPSFDKKALARMECGQRLEKLILDWHAESVKECGEWQELLQSTEHGEILATPDGFEYIDDKQCPLDIKCHSELGWKHGVPDYIQTQLQMQMYVTGAHAGVIVEWAWGIAPPKRHVFFRNERLITGCVSRAVEAWKSVERIRAQHNINEYGEIKNDIE